METPQTQDVRETVKTLNVFLRGEIAAVQTYRLGLDMLHDQSLRLQLEVYLRSHAHRIDLLRREIDALGGEADAGSGAWGAFAHAVQMGATLISDSMTIAALEEGESHGLRLYLDNIQRVRVPKSFFMVTSEVLPAQEKTYLYLHQLRQAVAH